MPVILGSKESTDTWLSGSASSFKSVMKPYEESDLVGALQKIKAIISIFFYDTDSVIQMCDFSMPSLSFFG